MDSINTTNGTQDVTTDVTSGENSAASTPTEKTHFDLMKVLRFMLERFPRLTRVLIVIVVLTILLQIPFIHDFLYKIPVSIASVPLRILGTLFGVDTSGL